MNNQHLSWHIDCPVCNPVRAEQMNELAADYGRRKEDKEMEKELDCKYQGSCGEECVPKMTEELREWFRRRDNGELVGRAPETPCTYYNGLGVSGGVWLCGI